MTAAVPLLDAIRKARGAVAACPGRYVDLHTDDLVVLIDAAVQSLVDADDVRRVTR